MTKEENLFFAQKHFASGIYSGARVENVNVTFAQTQTIIDGFAPRGVPLSEIEKVINLRNAWQYLLAHHDAPFNLEFACKINSLVAKNESLDWGVLRTGAVGIAGVESYAPPIPDEKQVRETIQKCASHADPTTGALDYFAYATRGQLFWDGNKRTALLCANKILIDNGKGLLLITERKIDAFNADLNKFYNTGDDSTLRKTLTSCIQTSRVIEKQAGLEL